MSTPFTCSCLSARLSALSHSLPLPFSRLGRPHLLSLPAVLCSRLRCPAPSSSCPFHSSSALRQKPRPAPSTARSSSPPSSFDEAEAEEAESCAEAEAPHVDPFDSPSTSLHRQQRTADIAYQRRKAKADSSPPTPSPSPSARKSPGRPAGSSADRHELRAALLSTPVDISNVTLINSQASSRALISLLTSPALLTRYHAIDTEVTGIDAKLQSPVHHGRVTALTLYLGPDVNLGQGPRVFVDFLDPIDGCDMAEEWKVYLEDERVRKVFHHYSFDYHVLLNAGVRVRGFAGDTMHMARLWDTSRASYSLESLSGELLEQGKVGMKDRFSVGKLKKDGTEGLALELPPIDAIQRGSQREAFIDYATFDAECTWKLRQLLELELRNQPNPAVAAHPSGPNMWSWYSTYYVPFAQLLVEMERAGVYVRVKDYLPQLQAKAEEAQRAAVAGFLDWAVRYEPNARYLNVHSNAQKKHLFFAPKGQEEAFDRDNVEQWVEPGKKKAKKSVPFTLRGFGLAPISLTKGKDAAVSVDVLQKLSGRPDDNPPQYGAAYQHFAHFDATSTHQDGVDACKALHQLTTLSALSTTLNTFLLPLQTQSDSESRIHCSLNLNTETGRLSSRRPNLQNQPALEKDVYRIRDAFAAPPGRLLIVADYGQLELRVLAHMSQCASMIEAFKAGGDFHSRTAMGMYSHIRDAVQRGEVVLEGGEGGAAGKGAGGEVRRLKDVYASERRKAKTLNFSIAYGKTARGLALDWGTSVEEAEATLQKWYEDRPEVKRWQQRTIEEAHHSGYTRTLMGRYRLLKGINGRDRPLRSHLERAAINTPIQGGAADIVMMSMIQLWRQQRFSQLGWRMILQIHDELICEGPEDSVDEAMAIVRQAMAHPFSKPLLVDLVIDAKAERTWYRAK